MKKSRKYLCLVVGVFCLVAFGFSAPTVTAAEKKLTVTSFGGSYQAAQRKAYFEPFAKQYGVKIIEDEWHGDMAKLRAMVQSGNVTWDVLAISDGQLELACDEGLIEPLDSSVYGAKENYIEGAVTECGIQLLVCGIVIGYDANQFKGNEPTKLTDFWDVKKFPGPRCMKKWPKHNMEFALLADGVAPGDIYKVLSTEKGITRAFKKLDEIKPHVKVWFTSWAQPGQLMADGEVAMSTGTNGRLLVAQRSHSNVKFMWDNQGLTSDNWAVVKGCKHKELAFEFVKFACQPENQAEFPKHIAYGPTHKKAIGMMNPELAKQMPSHPDNMDVVWKIDSRWWSDHNDDLSIRFNAWLAK